MSRKKEKKKKKKGTSQYQKLRINKKIKNMDDLHFVPNNILTRIFKELIKYKNDYQQYLNYICGIFFFFWRNKHTHKGEGNDSNTKAHHNFTMHLMYIF